MPLMLGSWLPYTYGEPINGYRRQVPRSALPAFMPQTCSLLMSMMSRAIDDGQGLIRVASFEVGDIFGRARGGRVNRATGVVAVMMLAAGPTSPAGFLS